MKSYILILLLLLTSGVFAQNKKLKKLDKLYENNEINKGLELSKKLKAEMPDVPAYFYYSSLFYLKKSNTVKTKSYKSNFLKQFIKYAEKGLALDSGEFLQQNDYLDLFHNELKSYAIILEAENSDLAHNQHQILAQYFKDTTTFYRYSLIQVVDENIKVAEVETYTKDSIKIYTIDSINVIRKELISYAETLLGIPYVYGGETHKGLDCSGFNLLVYQNAGIDLPHNAHMQSKLGKKVAIQNAQEGDLIFFGNANENGYRASHTGLVYKNDNEGFEIIHCISKGVVIDIELWKSYWSDRVLFVKSIIE